MALPARLIARRSQATVARTSFGGSGSRSVTSRVGIPAWRRAARIGSATKPARTSTAHSRQGSSGCRRRSACTQASAPRPSSSGVGASRMVIGGPSGAFGSAGRKVFGSASGSSAAMALAARRMVGVER